MLGIDVQEERLNPDSARQQPAQINISLELVSDNSSSQDQHDRMPADQLVRFTNLAYGKPTLLKPNRVAHHRHSFSKQDQGKYDLRMQLQKMAEHKKLKNQAEDFIIQFNKDPKSATKNMKPSKIARWLFRTMGLDKDVLGQYFARPDSVQIFQKFCSKIDFQGVEVDISLRMLLSKFRLRGEEQQVDRIIRVFAKTWSKDNPGRLAQADQIHVLVYSLIMLNTDLHSNNIEHKMTMFEFVRNTQPVVPNMPTHFLQEMYRRIADQKIQTKIDQIQKIYGRLRLLSQNSIRQNVDQFNQLNKGHIVVKYCRNRTAVTRLLFLQDSKICWKDPKNQDELPRFIKIQDIYDLCLGSVTPTMRANSIQPQFDPLCFSFITSQRSLDLRATEQLTKIRWIQYVSSKVMQRRDEKRRLQQHKFNSNYTKQKLQEIWMVDILPNWDKHWRCSTFTKYTKHIQQKEQTCTCFPFLCFMRKRNAFQESFEANVEKDEELPVSIRTQLLNKMWRLGLTEGARKVLWGVAVGNRLELSKELYVIHKSNIPKKKKLIRGKPQETNVNIPSLLLKAQIEQQFKQVVSNILTVFSLIRPDLLILPCMALIAQHLDKHLKSEEQSFILFANLMHSNHLMSFLRSNMDEIWLRVVYFQRLLQRRMPLVHSHFKALDLTTDLYFINWLLGLFTTCIQDSNIIARIFDCFFLDGEIFLFRVGLCLIQYFQLELKTANFQEASMRLSLISGLSEVVLFNLIQRCEISWQQFDKYVGRRQVALQNTHVKAALLDQ